MVIAEIQENFNLTYRLYDYGRTNKNGCNPNCFEDGIKSKIIEYISDTLYTEYHRNG